MNYDYTDGRIPNAPDSGRRPLIIITLVIVLLAADAVLNIMHFRSPTAQAVKADAETSECILP